MFTFDFKGFFIYLQNSFINFVGFKSQIRMIKLFVKVLLLISLPIAVFSQKPVFQFEQITDKGGRSLGCITGIVQDKYGFLWFSTKNGLYRYDGYSYKTFKNDPNDSTSLPFNGITYLFYDKSETFWLRHYDRLAAFRNEKKRYYL